MRFVFLGTTVSLVTMILILSACGHNRDHWEDRDWGVPQRDEDYNHSTR